MFLMFFIKCVVKFAFFSVFLSSVCINLFRVIILVKRFNLVGITLGKKLKEIFAKAGYIIYLSRRYHNPINNGIYLTNAFPA